MSEDYLTMYVEAIAMIKAIEAYVTSDKLYDRDVVRRILGVEVEKDDD